MKRKSRSWHGVRAGVGPQKSWQTPNFGQFFKYLQKELSGIRENDKKNDSECIGIAEGGARTRDLEVVIYRSDKSHTLYRLSYPGRFDDLVHCVNWLLTDGGQNSLRVYIVLH